jgi:hypothetical protein
VNLDDLVQNYITLRDQVGSLEDTIKVHKEAMKELEIQMLAQCNEVGAETIKTSHGLVMKQLKERYWAGDWDAFYPLVRENPELLEKRIAQGNFRAYVQEHLNGEMPVGVNVQREYVITVRRSST